MTLLFVCLIALALITFAILWLVLFPDESGRLFQRLRQLWHQFNQRTDAKSQQMSEQLANRSSLFAQRFSRVIGDLLNHKTPILIVTFILITPSLLIFALRQNVMLDGYSTSITTNSSTANLIASLMRGEQLAPPPALPPAVFVTKEIEQARPHLQLGKANRNWQLLDADFRQRLLAVFKVMREQYGYQMVMIEGYRSPQRQAYLASKGADVTNAGAGQSYHQYGMAADCAFFRDGKLVISEKDQWAMRGYQLYGKTAKEAGLVWGGSWRSIQDLGHVELHAPGRGPGRG